MSILKIILILIIYLSISIAEEKINAVLVTKTTQKTKFKVTIRCIDKACQDGQYHVETKADDKYKRFTLELEHLILKNKQMNAIQIEIKSEYMGGKRRKFIWNTQFLRNKIYMFYLGEFNVSDPSAPGAGLFLRGILKSDLPQLDDAYVYRMTLSKSPLVPYIPDKLLPFVPKSAIYSQLFVSNQTQNEWHEDTFRLKLNLEGCKHLWETKQPQMLFKIEKVLLAECPFCLQYTDDEDKLPHRLKACNHFVHDSCLQKSIKTTNNKKCPVCRDDILFLESGKKDQPAQTNTIKEVIYRRMKKKTVHKFVIRQPVLQNGEGGIRFTYELELDENGKISGKNVNDQSLKVVDERAMPMLLLQEDTMPASDSNENLYNQGTVFPPFAEDRNQPILPDSVGSYPNEHYDHEENNISNYQTDFDYAYDREGNNNGNFQNDFYFGEHNQFMDDINAIGNFLSDFPTTTAEANQWSSPPSVPPQQQQTHSPTTRTNQPQATTSSLSSSSSSELSQDNDFTEAMTDEEFRLMWAYKESLANVENGDLHLLSGLSPEKRAMIIKSAKDMFHQEMDEQILESFSNSADHNFTERSTNDGMTDEEIRLMLEYKDIWTKEYEKMLSRLTPEKQEMVINYVIAQENDMELLKRFLKTDRYELLRGLKNIRLKKKLIEEMLGKMELDEFKIQIAQAIAINESNNPPTDLRKESKTKPKIRESKIDGDQSSQNLATNLRDNGKAQMEDGHKPSNIRERPRNPTLKPNRVRNGIRIETDQEDGSNRKSKTQERQSYPTSSTQKFASYHDKGKAKIENIETENELDEVDGVKMPNIRANSERQFYQDGTYQKSTSKWNNVRNGIRIGTDREDGSNRLSKTRERQSYQSSSTQGLASNLDKDKANEMETDQQEGRAHPIQSKQKSAAPKRSISKKQISKENIQKQEDNFESDQKSTFANKEISNETDQNAIIDDRVNAFILKQREQLRKEKDEDLEKQRVIKEIMAFLHGIDEAQLAETKKKIFDALKEKMAQQEREGRKKRTGRQPPMKKSETNERTKQQND